MMASKFHQFPQKYLLEYCDRFNFCSNSLNKNVSTSENWHLVISMMTQSSSVPWDIRISFNVPPEFKFFNNALLTQSLKLKYYY